MYYVITVKHRVTRDTIRLTFLVSFFFSHPRPQQHRSSINNADLDEGIIFLFFFLLLSFKKMPEEDLTYNEHPTDEDLTHFSVVRTLRIGKLHGKKPARKR